MAGRALEQELAEELVLVVSAALEESGLVELEHQMANHTCHCSISYQCRIRLRHRKRDHNDASKCHRRGWTSTNQQANLMGTLNLKSYRKRSKSQHHPPPV